MSFNSRIGQVGCVTLAACPTAKVAGRPIQEGGGVEWTAILPAIFASPAQLFYEDCLTQNRIGLNIRFKMSFHERKSKVSFRASVYGCLMLIICKRRERRATMANKIPHLSSLQPASLRLMAAEIGPSRSQFLLVFSQGEPPIRDMSTFRIRALTLDMNSLVTADQRMTAPGRIARALAVFSIDEVIVFDDSPASSRPRQTDTSGYTGDTDPCHFMTHILSFLEAPPFMRKALFPLHPNLRLTALLPSLDMPHHPNPKEWIPYREGVTISGKTSTGKGTLVEVGLDEPVEIEDKIPPKTRVTLLFPEDESQHPACVDPAAPRTEGGYYWGYTVRQCSSLSSVFTESPYEDGYDISVGTSERGIPISKVFPPSKRVNFKHMLIVFGGPRGLEFASMNDEQLSGMDIQGPKTRELFDHWINVLPNQGSRTIRTEEALFIALTAMRGIWDSS